MYDVRVLADGIHFGEGARWRDGKLWLSEIFENRVITVTESGEIEVVCELPDKPSGLGWLPDGRLLIAGMQSRCVWRLDPGGPVVHADISGVAVKLLNDMVVDGRGNAYVGSTGVDYYTAPTDKQLANVVLVRPDGSFDLVADGVAAPNGPLVTPDNRTYIVSESNADRVIAFDINTDGTLANRRVFAEVHHPDGICLDSEGALWVASPHKQCCLRIKEGGEVTDRVERPHSVVCCVLGGADLKTLFMSRVAEGSPLGPGAYSVVETLRVPVPGV